jgi:hypothetical protein
MKIDVIRVRNIPENWELELLLKERDIERRQRLYQGPSTVFLYSVAFTFLFGSVVLAVFIWKFFL